MYINDTLHQTFVYTTFKSIRRITINVNVKGKKMYNSIFLAVKPFDKTIYTKGSAFYYISKSKNALSAFDIKPSLS